MYAIKAFFIDYWRLITGKPLLGEGPNANDAMWHLGNVLHYCADIHPDDRCDALDSALEFYNAASPNWHVAPSDYRYQRLVDPPLFVEPQEHSVREPT